MLTNITFIVCTHAAYFHLSTQSELLQQVIKVRRVFSGASPTARSAPLWPAPVLQDTVPSSEARWIKPRDSTGLKSAKQKGSTKTLRLSPGRVCRRERSLIFTRNLREAPAWCPRRRRPLVDTRPNYTQKLLGIIFSFKAK